MSNLLKNGSRGDEVKALQTSLQKLGFDIKPDGVFGEQTETAVKKLQTMFGYTVDGLVGDGTKGLIGAQIGHGWNVKAPDAQKRAQAAQGKSVDVVKKGASAGPVKKK